MFTAIAEAQVFTLVPATAVGSFVIVIVLFEVAFGHPPLTAVRVRVTLPAAISAALGV